MTIILFYENDAEWEKNYIINTLFKNYTLDTYFISSQQMRDPRYFDMFNKIKPIVNNCILAFTSNPDHKKHIFDHSLENRLNKFEIYHIIKLIKPKIVIHLSDEFGKRPELNLLANYTPLLLRQHSHPGYPLYKNLIHIPLGYMTGMFEKNFEEIILKKPSERKYIWSFVGNMKQDRELMIKTFSNMKPYVFQKATPTQMREIYRESIFVPNGRGFFMLDCFRLYEATLCGAIPVVVGNHNEIKNSFQSLQQPPFVYCIDWVSAVRRCSDMLQKPELLEEYQTKLLEWWRKIIGDIRNKINKII